MALRSRFHRIPRMPRRRAFTIGGRSGGGGASGRFVRYRGRGGFFGSIFKGIKTAVHVASSVLPKTLISSVPILGGAITAVGAAKAALRPPTLANVANQTAIAGALPLGQPTTAIPRGLHRRKRKKVKTTKRTTKRARRRKGRAGGTAKQRAARARFARAARKGRIKKGQRL